MKRENHEWELKKDLEKLKQPRMTIEQLAIIVAQQGTKLDRLATIVVEGFVTINKEIGEIKVILQRHEDILNKHTEILERHESIFKRII